MPLHGVTFNCDVRQLVNQYRQTIEIFFLDGHKIDQMKCDTNIKSKRLKKNKHLDSFRQTKSFNHIQLRKKIV